jgi:hypothetical protein
LGRWSVGLAAAFILLFALVLVLAFLGVYAGEPGRFRLVALIVTAAFGISGIGSFVTGLISIMKSKDRSILVFVAVVGIGLFTLMFLIFFIGEEVFLL